MEHKPIGALRDIAEVRIVEQPLLSRRARLERWAEVLERQSQRRLKSLRELELVARAERLRLRADNSPLSVAYADPVLRDEGLRSDRLGDAMAFFVLSERQAHRLVCSCINGLSMEAGTAARQIRRIAASQQRVQNMAKAVSAWFRGLTGFAYSAR